MSEHTQGTDQTDRLLNTTLTKGELSTLKAHNMAEDLIRLPVAQAKTVARKLKQGYDICYSNGNVSKPFWASVLLDAQLTSCQWRVWSIPQYEKVGVAEVTMQKTTRLHMRMQRELRVYPDGSFSQYTWEP
jgi:hypothetical protein